MSLEVMTLPHNRSQTIKHQQNSKSINESEIGLKSKKQPERPPNQNGIDKNIT
jgi:hypothetical protein